MDTADKLITENLDLWTSPVKAKSSAGRGSGKKRELYGIQKLRELILELAVRGLLVVQNPDDEPASELLKQIDSERHRLAKNGIFKKPRPLVAVEQNETPYELPEGWAFTRNGALFGLKKGKVPKDLSESEGSIPYLDIEALDRGNIRRHTNDEKAPKSTEEDILVVCDGSRSGLVLDGKNGAIGSTLSVIETPSFIQSYVKLVFLQAYQRLNSTMKGAAIPHLDTKQLLIDIIGLPPLAEQHRIVAKVDELMALCDQLEQEQESSLDTHDTLVATLLGALTEATASAEAFAQAWQRIQANFDTLFTTESSIDQLKQTILQLAVMGKLSSQSEHESATYADSHSRDEHLSIWNHHLPHNWAIAHLSEVVNSTQGVQIPKAQQLDRTTDGYKRYLYISDFKNDSSPKYIKDKFPNKEVKTSDLIMVNTGATSGQVFYGKPGILSNNLFKISFDTHFTQEYLYIFLSSPAFRDKVFGGVKGGANPHLGHKSFGRQLVSIPPLAEQHRIVAKVDELMALCDQLKASLATAQTTQLNLADSLVEQAIG